MQDTPAKINCLKLFTRAKEIKEKSGCLRLGQASYNLLYQIYPEIAREILYTPNDPFYMEDCTKFWFWLFERLHETGTILQEF